MVEKGNGISSRSYLLVGDDDEPITMMRSLSSFSIYGILRYLPIPKVLIANKIFTSYLLCPNESDKSACWTTHTTCNEQEVEIEASEIMGALSQRAAIHTPATHYITPLSYLTMRLILVTLFVCWRVLNVWKLLPYIAVYIQYQNLKDTEKSYLNLLINNIGIRISHLSLDLSHWGLLYDVICLYGLW
jgi:hypothetical protein